MFHFDKKYCLYAILFFLLEVFIALYVRDSYIRPYGGDFLVVIFLYCLLKSFFKISVKNAIFGLLLFAFAIEGLQYFGFAKHMGLQENLIASVILGNHFEWLDMLFYTLGALTVYFVEMVRRSF